MEIVASIYPIKEIAQLMDNLVNDKKFWRAVKPVFSNGDRMGDKIILIENGEVVSDDKIIAECLNTHFVNITDSLA